MRAGRIAILVLFIDLQAACAQAEPAAVAIQPPASQPASTVPTLAATLPAEKSAKSAADEIASRPEPWRYQWHNNHWWFYTPQNDWLYYTTSGWHPYVAPAATYSQPSYRSYNTRRRVDPGHSLDTTGNYPRFWLWQRLGN